MITQYNLKNEILFLDFEEKYANNFYNLNVAWLKKFFYVEPYDEKVLSNPNEFIIKNGGFVFFVKYKEKIVATAAFINQNEYFELSKMAVLEDFQGKKIGQMLLQHCIAFAKNKKWENVILYSNTKLKPAIHLYKKVGFIEIPLEKDVHYKRSDIKMILSL